MFVSCVLFHQCTEPIMYSSVLTANGSGESEMIRQFNPLVISPKESEVSVVK